MRSVAATCGALLALLVSASPALAQDRYELANGCFNLRVESTGALVAKDADGYRAGAGSPEPFRMQATALGKYLLYGAARDFLSVDGGGIAPAGEPSGGGDWTVSGDDAGGYELVAQDAGRALAVDGGGRLVSVPAGQAGRFGFAPAQGCALYPEVDVSASGTPLTGSPLYGETRGMVDPHMHMMAFEFLGGSVHCGRPWHPYGAPYALEDCPDHTASNGSVTIRNQPLPGPPLWASM